VNRLPYVLLAILLPGLVAVAAWAQTYVWVDEEGVTHITDDSSQAPDGAQSDSGDLAELWDSPVGEGFVSAKPGGQAEARTRRLIRGAIEDLSRGETARASVALEAVLVASPGQPEAHWYLALLDRQRGRYASATVHLKAFLASAGDGLEPWRKSAERRLAALVDEAHLADPTNARSTGPWQGLANQHFRVHYDPQLGQAAPGYAQTVLRYLEEARSAVSQRLGAVPEEAMGVVFYSKAAYIQAHRHRFSFETIGFFDGQIHVVSAAHPAGELRSLLFHEYSHAAFREKTGGDRPYWLNEGLAELAERASLGRQGLTHSERAALRIAIDSEAWLPLKRLAPSFAGLDDEAARTAYLESAAAAVWITRRTDRAQRARLLELLAAGLGADQALAQVLGIDTAVIDASVREGIRGEFPSEATIDAPHPEPAKLREATP
jgi:hypothetical protein